jgi:hypothetical protein
MRRNLAVEDARVRPPSADNAFLTARNPEFTGARL